MRLSSLVSLLVLATTLASCSATRPSMPAIPAGPHVAPFVFQNGQQPTNWIEFEAKPGAIAVDITVGGDGNIWFIGCCPGTIGKVTMAGVVTNYALPTDHFAQALVLGPKGDIWFTEGQQYLGKITPAGVITEYRIPIPNEVASGITVGPDGNLWFYEQQPAQPPQAMIGRMRPDGRFLAGYPASVRATLFTGPDGRVWYADADAQHIDAMNAAGQVTQYCCAPFAGQIVTGPDGNLWFVAAAAVGKITTSGVITEYSEPSSLAYTGLAVGRDKHIYLSASSSGSPSYVGRVSLTGFTQFFQNPTSFQENSIVRGPDNNLWFAEQPDIGVYVRFVLSVTPATITFTTTGQTQTITVSEQNYHGSWAATSLNPTVATVAPATGNTFTVTAVGSGSTSIDVADHMHNDFLVSVTVP